MEELHDIIAVGAGTSSKIVCQGEHLVERIENLKDVRQYITRIDEIIHRKELIKKDLVDNNKSCQKCELKYFCGGGCRAEATNHLPCKYNCSYYKFALEYYGENIYKK